MKIVIVEKRIRNIFPKPIIFFSNIGYLLLNKNTSSNSNKLIASLRAFQYLNINIEESIIIIINISLFNLRLINNQPAIQ